MISCLIEECEFVENPSVWNEGAETKAVRKYGNHYCIWYFVFIWSERFISSGKRREFWKAVKSYVCANHVKLWRGGLFLSFRVFNVSVSVNRFSFICLCLSFFLYAAWLSRHRFFSNEQYSDSSSWSRWVSQRESFPTRNRNLLPADNCCGKCAAVLNNLQLVLLIGRREFKTVLSTDNVGEGKKYILLQGWFLMAYLRDNSK